jgi:O-antigen ligase
MAIRFDLRTFFNLLATTFAIFVVVGIMAAAIPGVGITPGGAYAGAWRGLSGQKNVFARTLALAVALLPAAVLLGLTARRKSWLILAFVALVLLVLARSATALAAALGGLSAGAVLYAALGGRVRRVRLRPELGIAFLAIAATSGALIVAFGWTPILEAFGRDATLTGRTNLWRWAMGLNPDQSWLGSGYRAFWIDSNTKYFFEFFWWRLGPDGARSDTFAGPEHAHSGYIDTRLELGWLGIGMFALMICSALGQLRRVLVHGDLQVGFIFAVILSFLLIYAITERSILQRSEDLWFLFTALYLFLLKGAFERKPTFED